MIMMMIIIMIIIIRRGNMSNSDTQVEATVHEFSFSRREVVSDRWSETPLTITLSAFLFAVRAYVHDVL